MDPPSRGRRPRHHRCSCRRHCSQQTVPSGRLRAGPPAQLTRPHILHGAHHQTGALGPSGQTVSVPMHPEQRPPTYACVVVRISDLMEYHQMVAALYIMPDRGALYMWWTRSNKVSQRIRHDICVHASSASPEPRSTAAFIRSTKWLQVITKKYDRRAASLHYGPISCIQCCYCIVRIPPDGYDSKCLF